MNLRRLGRPMGHRKALVRNLVTALLEHEKIETTEVKAKEVRIVTENMISLAKKGDIHSRRQAARMISNKEILKKLFDEIATRYQDRDGGYTRIVKLGPRRGDASPMAIIELI